MTTETAPGRWYVTTAIPYVNARPHIGFALELALTDAMARFHRLRGEDVWFLTGTDDNSLKNVQAAEREGLSPAALVARNTAYFVDLETRIRVSNDDFIRTSAEERHAAGVRKLWEACARNGDIYTKPYRGLYCVGCEQFYTEDELVGGLCPEHLTRPEVVEEENYFFRLSRYGEQLAALIESDALHIVPQSRRNEVLSFIRRGLEDFSISRSQARARGWGIPVPGDPDQVMYVWFDALGNYISALGYATDDERYLHYWAENPHRVHVIGKGITRFHAIYWPAMLLSAGVPPPTAIFVHGYVTVEGQKIGKALGNAIDPVELIDAYGADALRFYLLREIPATDDGDFSRERFVGAYNSDLANKLGNLLNRTISMVGRYCEGMAPAPGSVEPADEPLIATARGLRARVDAAMERFAPHEALAAIWELVDAANKYVEDTAPWTLAKRRKAGPNAEEAGARLATVLYSALESLRLLSLYARPFIPDAAAAMARQLGLDPDAGGAWDELTTWGRYPAGTRVQSASVLFPRVEEAEH
jgi:methionyl-tRNA synthetase